MIKTRALYVGDTVLYHFKSYQRQGSSDLEIRIRPAIITSIEMREKPLPDTDSRLLNMHVLFEDRDFVTGLQREFSESGSVRAFQRRQVPYSDGVPADHRWSLTERMQRSEPKPPASLADILGSVIR